MGLFGSGDKPKWPMTDGKVLSTNELKAAMKRDHEIRKAERKAGKKK